jgi:hypothetical protein
MNYRSINQIYMGAERIFNAPLGWSLVKPIASGGQNDKQVSSTEFWGFI